MNNKLMKKINFFQDNINYDDIMSYGDNSYEDNYDEIILNDDIFIDADEKFNEDTKRYRYFAYIDNEKINITKDEYKLIRNLWAITKKTKKNALFTLIK